MWYIIYMTETHTTQTKGHTMTLQTVKSNLVKMVQGIDSEKTSFYNLGAMFRAVALFEGDVEFPEGLEAAAELLESRGYDSKKSLACGVGAAVNLLNA